MELKASPGRCEEASTLSHSHYIPCNAPAKWLVKTKDEKPYRMCMGCADHNVRNRGAHLMGTWNMALIETYEYAGFKYWVLCKPNGDKDATIVLSGGAVGHTARQAASLGSIVLVPVPGQDSAAAKDKHLINAMQQWREEREV